MKLEAIFLVDLSKKLVRAWEEVFSPFKEFKIVQGDFFDISADAMVSPANSFGIMDGGLDLAIRHELGFEVESKLQKRILEEYHGELPVGSALIVSTHHKKWPYLISAPTMRVPENISNTLNAYLAFRAILLTVQKQNQKTENKIKSILCPGLGTGIGNLEPRKCAAQMRIAYQYLSNRARIPSYHEINQVHRK